MSLHNTPKKADSQEKNHQTKGLFPFWKKPGETLATMLRRFREEHNLGSDEKLTYAGRLDPMAEGIVPILSGEARFQKERFMNRSKTYEVEVLLGIGTDTGDMLGLATPNVILSQAKGDVFVKQGVTKIEKALEIIRQTVSLPYPNYSSIPVDGKPLFVHARAGNKVVLPIKKVKIYDLELLSIKERKFSDLVAESVAVIEKVEGDFRQQEIIAQWEDMEREYGNETVQIVTIRTTVSSGTYMRAIAEKLGLLLKMPALAYGIKRISIEGMQ
ncbi:MAG TPA: hypothetical protein VL576_03440 [Candidatus Paceibacterota bacterium]|jgi:tRNA pseudouridine(55) synthase|nr:hypothetical protein [Candidatus Paceibacterota bacterium]